MPTLYLLRLWRSWQRLLRPRRAPALPLLLGEALARAAAVQDPVAVAAEVARVEAVAMEAVQADAVTRGGLAAADAGQGDAPG